MLIEWQGLSASRSISSMFPQAGVQSGGQDYQPGFDLITRSKCDVLPCRIAGNRRDFRCGMVDVIRDLPVYIAFTRS